MLDVYKEGQPIAYKLMVNSIKNNKISHAYLIEANNNPDALDIALAYVKYIVCPHNYTNNLNCKNCNLCQRIDNNNYLELKIISSEGLWIKKEQAIDLQNEFSKKPLEGTKKIYIITEAEKMNGHTANSLLKFLEEPDNDIIAILITNNINMVLKTIVSRCQLLSLQKKDLTKYDNYLQKIASLICSNNVEINSFLNNEESIQLLNNVLDFIKLYEENGLDTLIYLKKIWHNNFKEKKDNIMALDIMINFYYETLKYKTNKNINIFTDNIGLIDRISLTDIETIFRKIEVLIEIRDLIRYNLNMNLLIDKMIIELEGV